MVDTDVQETLGREVTVRVESSGKPVGEAEWRPKCHQERICVERERVQGGGRAQASLSSDCNSLDIT